MKLVQSTSGTFDFKRVDMIDAAAEASRLKYKDTSPLLPAINSGGHTVPGSHRSKFKHHALSTGLVQSLLDTDNPL